jgi:energy-coupling factor transporter ATP-binding protein EcfA2
LNPGVTRSGAFVVAVSGTSGSGKSTLVRGLAAALGASAGPVFFDDYAAVSDLPEDDLGGWLARGGDPDEWRTDRLAADLRALRAGDAVGALDGGALVGPFDLVVLEEPFGRARSTMAPHIDLVLHIRLPLHVALARRLTRDFVPVTGEVAADRADRLRGYLAMYLDVGGAVYDHIDRLASASSDTVLDGLLSAADLLAAALDEVAAARASG